MIRYMHDTYRRYRVTVTLQAGKRSITPFIDEHLFFL